MKSTATSATKRNVNLLDRTVWSLLNICCGGFASMIMLVWVSCDMEMPKFFFPLLRPSLLQSIFRVPWIELQLSLLSKIAFNACLFALFGFVHTFFARETTHRYIITRLSFPPARLRTVYLMLTNAAAWLLMGLWQRTTVQLWDFLTDVSYQTEYRRHAILLILFTLINIPGGLVIMHFNPLEFFGLKQIFQSTGCPATTTRTAGMNKLVTNGIFHYCRHPMYLFLLIGFVVSPVVSLDKFLFVIYTILYLYIAIPIEERKLEIIFGQAYMAYQKSVPSVVPTFYREKTA